jgi:hypothetical protein
MVRVIYLLALFFYLLDPMLQVVIFMLIFIRFIRQTVEGFAIKRCVKRRGRNLNPTINKSLYYWGRMPEIY